MEFEKNPDVASKPNTSKPQEPNAPNERENPRIEPTPKTEAEQFNTNDTLPPGPTEDEGRVLDTHIPGAGLGGPNGDKDSDQAGHADAYEKTPVQGP